MAAKIAPRGLANLGNTCFFNSVMQNMVTMDDFSRGIQEETGIGAPLHENLRAFFREMRKPSSSKNSMSPSGVFNAVCKYHTRFRGGRQHDSHELLRAMLDSLREEKTRPPPVSKKGQRAIEKSGIVDRLFGGSFLNCVQCLKCKSVSLTTEAFMDISLAISPPPGSSNNLKTNNNNNNNSMRNDGEIVRTQARRRAMVKDCPETLTIHLKRFAATARGFSKVGKHVSIPLQLDMAPYTIPKLGKIEDKPEPILYSLSGIVVHSGGMGGGHYVAYTRRDSSSWFYFSDRHYKDVKESSVLNAQAYVCFYKRVR
eukprot:jgi/Bigna1/38416/e_gw1.25.82.1